MQASPASLSKLLLLTAFALVRPNVFSAPETAEITATRAMVRGNDGQEFDWAKSQARARIVYTSSGPKTFSNRMIDNDLQTMFRFSESDETPTVIVELARSTDLYRVATIFKAEDAELNVYLVNELPKDLSDLRFARPDALVVSEAHEHGMATVNVSVRSARYVVLRWKRKRSNDPFTVAEISALSNTPAELVSDTNPDLAENTQTFAALAPPIIPFVSP